MAALCANVYRSGPCHDAVLSMAAEENAAFVLVQEPWLRAAHAQTKNHPFFSLLGPVTRWEPRPRSFLYFRADLVAEQLPLESPDLSGAFFPSIGLTVLSVYSPPATSLAWLLPFLSRLPLGCLLIAGDFNARHPLWDSRSDPSAGTDEFLAALPRRCSLISPPDIATHRLGGVLDLVWSNVQGAQVTVSEFHSVGSDHLPLLINLPTTIPSPGSVLAKDPGPGIREFLELPPPPPLDSATNIDVEAELLAHGIAAAYKASAARTRSSRRSAPWWSPELTRLRRLCTLDGDWAPFHKAVRRAKASHWKEVIGKAQTPADVFRIGRWRSKRDPLGHPPIIGPDGPISDGQGKAEAFLRRLLSKSQGNLAHPVPGPAGTPLPCFPSPLADSIRDCVIGVSNTSPGPDLISVKVLEHIWDLVGERIARLYAACLRLGHHPQVWKVAKVVMVPKPGKDDLSNIRHWRPISLISCLSKGLERYIARWIAYTALDNQVLSSSHFGALPRRSALDLVAVFAAKIEDALRRRQCAALLLQDIDSAFDGVSHPILLSRLRLQGWDASLISWISSWLSSRQVSLCHGTGVARGSPAGGIPQGSPLSPILFALYVQPFAHAANRGLYADDIATLCVGPTPTSVDEMLVRERQANADLAEICGVHLAPEKEEVQLFSRRRKNLPEPWRTGQRSSTRWLGVYLDGKLTFKEHIRAWTGKAWQVACFLRSLGNTTRGLPPSSAKLLTAACVLPLALYGAEVYTARAAHGSMVAGSLPEHCTRLVDRALNAAARAIAPSWRTTPVAAIRREAGIPPARVLMADVRRRMQARLHRLDSRHLLRRPAPALSGLAALQDGHLHGDGVPLFPPLKVPTGVPHWQGAPPSDITVFTDGSRADTGETGCGGTILQGGITVMNFSFSLGKQAEVFDAEAEAAAHGAYLASSIPTTRFSPNLNIVLDNQAAVQNLQPGYPSLLAQAPARALNKARSLWATRSRLPHVPVGEVRVFWTRGHSGTAGNERADGLAKAGSRLPPSPQPQPPTLAYLGRERKVALLRESREWWAAHAPSSYRDLAIPWERKPRELLLPRRALSLLIQHRTGHGDFRAYHERFQHTDAEIKCRCGRDKTPVHPFFCVLTRRHLKRRGKRPWALSGGARTIDWLLGTARGAFAFASLFTDGWGASPGPGPSPSEPAST